MAEKSTGTRTTTKSAGSKAVSKSAGRMAPAKAAARGSSTKATAKPAKKKTTFKLSAPEASQVSIAGCFNDWSLTANPLSPGNGGMWTCTLLLEPGEYEYRFIVDGIWCDDPAAAMRRPTEYGCENCIIIV